MVIVVESGATKADWRSVSGKAKVNSVRTEGLNPMTMSYDDMRGIIASAIPAVNPEGRAVKHVYFYSAGLVSQEQVALLASLIALWCPFAEVKFHSDIEAAAIAALGDTDGVVAIMGTGSNSCLWKGGSLTENVRPGGFVLGDEGSGAALGRMFLADYIKRLVPENLLTRFEDRFQLDYASIVKEVYKGQAPSRFLASFAPFIMENEDDPYAAALIERNLRDFMERSLARYGCGKVGVVGSFGYACREHLVRLGKEYGLEFVKFVPSPIDELVEYHSRTISCPDED